MVDRGVLQFDAELDPLPVIVDNVRRETQRGPVLAAQVYEMTSRGWPYNHHPELNSFIISYINVLLCLFESDWMFL